jgi:hypothetical protein
MLGLLLWSYSLALGATPSARIASASLAGDEVIVASASRVIALDQRNGRVRWVRAGATLPADSYQGLIVASTSRGIEALNLDGSERWVRDVCGGHQPPLALATSGRSIVAACSYNYEGDALVHIVLLNASGAALSSRIEGAFVSNAPFRVMRINDHLVAFEQTLNGAAMHWVTTLIDVNTGQSIDSDESFGELLSRREAKAARRRIVCQADGTMADVLWSGALAFALCGGHGDPLTIGAYRV